MTENEAIQRLKYRIKTATDIAGNGADGNAYEDIEIAIKALEEKIKKNEFFNFDSPVAQTDYKELLRYKELGTVEELWEAREKQTPKRYAYGDDNGRVRKCCSRCGCFFLPASKYCSKCGQAIDWSEEE